MNPYKDALLITVVILAGAGLWLDTRTVLEQATIFVAFQAASLAGTLLAAVYLCYSVEGFGKRLLVLLCAAIVWRVSFFPIMVFAGWVATLGEWLLVNTGLVPVVIYPTFLIAMAAMHWGAVMLGGVMVLQKKSLWAPPLLMAFVVAVMVSMTAREDLTPLPDYSLAIGQSVPAVKAPQGNPYFEVLGRLDYGWPERVLIFASGAMYDMIPRTPWSTAVKSVLEHAFRDQPKASSAQRVREHYLAFRAAHPLIRCGDDCSGRDR